MEVQVRHDVLERDVADDRLRVAGAFGHREPGVPAQVGNGEGVRQ
jgi:hypothetical protein